MRKIYQYIGSGLLCISSAFASCGNTKEDPEVDTRGIVQKIVFDKETNQSYLVIHGELRGAFNEFIQSDINGDVIRYSSYPGWMRTSTYESDGKKRIHVKFFNGSSGNQTDFIDDLIDSEKVKDYKIRFERDRNLLKQAGLIE
ncbi:hypothetical protein JW851_00665 [Candidatus Woesearchaeota archaeon]|nr:hypothetical protein [Candidatus Woesearchaeota archaeon]